MVLVASPFPGSQSIVLEMPLGGIWGAFPIHGYVLIMRIFLAAAIVLVIFGIWATTNTTGAQTLWSVSWYTWFMASFLAYLVDLITGFAIGATGVTYVGSRRAQTPPGQVTQP